jgi:hypothetical protein
VPQGLLSGSRDSDHRPSWRRVARRDTSGGDGVSGDIGEAIAGDRSRSQPRRFFCPANGRKLDYCNNILTAISLIECFSQNAIVDNFQTDPARRTAVERELTIIDEAPSKLSVTPA